MAPFHGRSPLQSIHKSEGCVMDRYVTADIDFIEELRLRRWAREHYVTADARLTSWHPIVIDEMSRKDREQVLASAGVDASVA